MDDMEEYQKIDLEFEADGLIDDEQFSENSVVYNTHESAGALSTGNEVDNSLGVKETDNLPKLYKSTEPERNQKNGRYNLRKSLAWDSAFFTSAGVLDAEEFTTMITGTDKSDKHILPGIQEEITGSTESLSTLGSDALTLETLEDDLFVDIRASIQRSSKKTLDLRSSNSKTAAVEVHELISCRVRVRGSSTRNTKVHDTTRLPALKKERVTQNKIPKPCLKKTSSQQSDRMSKCQPKQKIGQTNAVLPKPPKSVSSSNPSSTAAGKRDSFGTGRTESGISNPVPVSGKGTQLLKVSSSGGVRRALPKPAPSSNSSLLASSSTVHSTRSSSSGGVRRALPKPAPSSNSSLLASLSTVHSARSSTSSDSSSSMSSRINPGKPNVMIQRRNTGKSGSVGTAPSGPVPKTPLNATTTTTNATLRNKLPPSSSKISSSVSPASSISEWSSVSSSSSSMVNQKYSNSRTSLDTSSCKSMEGDIIPLDSRTGGKGNQGLILTSNYPKKSSMHTGGNLQALAKPSGLRMPSHKFGFFDGAKASVPSPNNRHQQSPSAVQKQAFPKNGPGAGIPIRSSISKPKITKVPTARTVASPASIKPSSPKPTSPASLRGKKSTDVTNSPGPSTGVKQVAENTVAPTEESLGDLKKINTAPVVEGSDGLFGGDMAVDKIHVEKDSDKENGRDNTGTFRNVSGSTDELFYTSGCAPIVSESTPCRAPLALKNSLASDECIDMLKEVVDKTGFVSPVSEQKREQLI
ncbi:hypothetical protein OROHE_023756 [Orobanche hederae]